MGLSQDDQTLPNPKGVVLFAYTQLYPATGSTCPALLVRRENAIGHISKSGTLKIGVPEGVPLKPPQEGCHPRRPHPLMLKVSQVSSKAQNGPSHHLTYCFRGSFAPRFVVVSLKEAISRVVGSGKAKTLGMSGVLETGDDWSCAGRSNASWYVVV